MTLEALAQDLDAKDSYAARVGLLTLLGAHVEGLDMLIETLGAKLPENVLAETQSHQQSCQRLLSSVQASVVEEASRAVKEAS